MYNTELKQEYIEYKTSVVEINQYYLPALFKKTESFEENLKKDVGMFTAQEIEDMYKMMSIKSIASIQNMNSNLSQYASWLLTEKHLTLDSQNHFLEFTPNRLDSLVNKYIVAKKRLTREEVVDMASSALNASDGFLVLALFEGIKGKDYKELWSMTLNDVNAISGDINVPGRGVRKYSLELCRVAMAAGDETRLIGYGEASKTWPVVQSDLIIKNFPGCKDDVDDFRKGRRIYTRLIRVLRSFGYDQVTGYDLYWSGAIDFINRNSEKLGMSGYDYLNKHLKDFTKYYDVRPEVKRILRNCEGFLRT